MASDRSWKDKYLQELESSEQREQLWKAERNSLERMLVRTCLASEGQTPELDRLLIRVRKDLRKGNLDLEKWRSLQEQIDRQVTLLDDDSPKARSGNGRFYQSRKTVDVPSDSEPSPTVTVGDENDLATIHAQRLRIARRVGQLLGQMIYQVTLEPAAEARARQLQKSLLESESWDVLREGLNSVADLVIAAITRSQREFEAFLKKLDERLVSLRQHFQNQSNAQEGRMDASRELDREIRRELETFGRKIDSFADFKELKLSVTMHLETIGGVVERFREQESEREKSYSQQLEVMQEKLAAVEANSEQMREQIREERARALTDLLTQLPNREAWQERLGFEYSRWQRYRQPVRIAVLDIDLFKRVNDSFGHKAGDRVLQMVARECQKRLRTTDFISRFGGEEFVLLLPETSAEDAKRVLDDLRGYIAALPFHFQGEPVTITFSAGVATLEDGDTEETLFDRADRALYAAKDAGRNQVRLAIEVEGVSAASGHQARQ
ncbi:GGDEF domain-containing protein [uncultured Marinobacter sp.]|uniref:GGDEF domain-containing protein n=1 Tax=uncultured Marinobacter sp. TaxID=187379 RepID=UPI00261BB93E|nr:GGDEF domain-containing protein [uncultured Marinobacter sp.]